LAALAGCGDALVDNEYRGVAIWQLVGDAVEHEGGRPEETKNLRVAIFWSPGGPTVSEPGRYSEQPSTSVAVQLPSPFVLNIFEPPGPEHRVQAEGGAYALGRLLAYADRDRDGRRGPQEPFVGLEVPYAILYAERALPQGRTPTSGALAAGFHRVLLPQLCGRPLPMPTEPGDCGVPLGQSCMSSRDCGVGVCVESAGIPWTGGACAVPEPPMNGCRPGAGRYYQAQMGMGMGMGPEGYYLKACTTDAECRRPMDRIVGTYRCDPGLGACVPGSQVHVSLGGMVPFNPFCSR
jgi:hypothetical protein